MSHEFLYGIEDKVLYYGSSFLTPELVTNGRFIETGGTRFLVRSKSGMDRYIIHEVIEEQKYNAGIGTLKGKKVIDVGAHIGVHAVWAAMQGAEIIACEPFSPNCELLKVNSELNGTLDHIRILNAAVAGSTGERNLYVSRNNTGGHSLFKETGAKDEIKVPTVTLERIMNLYGLSFADVVKIDAEGAEKEIILTAPKSVLHAIGVIIMEDHILDKKHSYSDMVKRLQENGFNVERRLYKDYFLHKAGITIARRATSFYRA